jgi:hypothetical protein
MLRFCTRREAPSKSQPRNCALSHAVAAREFGKRSALRAPPPCFGLLRRRQFQRSAHMLPALLRPAAAFGGAGADKIALDTGVGIKRPSAVLVRPEVLPKGNRGSLAVIAANMFNMSLGRPASRSSRVTNRKSPASSWSSRRRSCARSAPLATSRNTLPAPCLGVSPPYP